MHAERAPQFAFEQIGNGWTVGRFAALSSQKGLVHAVTTRKGLDTSLARDDRDAAAGQVAGALGLAGVAFCRQVHGNTVLAAERPGLAGEADGLVTRADGLGLMGFSADCPLILAADPASGAVGMAHASWRGTVAGIASRLVQRLAEGFAVRAGDLIACIGPSAGPCCYQVGPEVVQAALGELGGHAEHFFPKRQGRIHFDLWKANTDALLRAGLAAANIHAAGVCTICRNDLLPSFRLEGGQAGRFVAVIASHRGPCQAAGGATARRGWRPGSG